MADPKDREKDDREETPIPDSLTAFESALEEALNSSTEDTEQTDK